MALTGPADAPYLGVGVGLRTVHYADVLDRGPRDELGVDWFEILSENYMVPGGRPLRILSEVREFAPLAMHGVSLNIGSTDPLDTRYLADLARLADRTRPSWISDHLCWTGVGGHNLHDLLPLPYTEEAVQHVATRVRQVQDQLERRIALENVSSYLTYVRDGMSEWEFLLAVAETADCGILLDVNNVYVSAHNHAFDAHRYIDSIPRDRVYQIHLAGHSESGPMLIDTHDHPVPDGVWLLFERTIERLGPISTLIEWDDAIPTYDTLIDEASKARRILDRAHVVDRVGELRNVSV
jgi:uncharacterized protein (UPF0276 family)